MIVKGEARLLGPIRLDKSSRTPRVTDSTSYEVCADVRPRSPGDMIVSLNIKSEQLLPCACVWAPLQTSVPVIMDVPSAAQEPRAFQGVAVSVSRQLGK